MFAFLSKISNVVTFQSAYMYVLIVQYWYISTSVPLYFVDVKMNKQNDS